MLKDIDNVEITCLVDNVVNMLLPSTPVARRAVVAKNWYEKPLIAEHGFCAALTVHKEGVKHTFLVDSGLDPLTAFHNVDVLGFDISSCECVISSHGHIDHAGGLINLKKHISKKEKLPLVLHEDALKD